MKGGYINLENAGPLSGSKWKREAITRLVFISSAAEFGLELAKIDKGKFDW